VRGPFVVQRSARGLGMRRAVQLFGPARAKGARALARGNVAMSDWFFMLGERLAGSEREQVRGYLNGLGLGGQTSIESVPNFAEAARIIAHPDWDRRWWDAEQRERERLCEKLARGRDRGQLLQALSQSAE